MIKVPVIRVFDTDLKFLNEIDVYSSVTFKKPLRGAGEFEIHMPYLNGIERLNIISIDGDGHKVGIVQDIQAEEGEENEVIVKGVTLNGLLNQRIILGTDDPSTFGYFALPHPSSAKVEIPVEDILKTYVQICFEGEDRTIENLAISPSKGRGKLTNWMARYENLEEVAISICEECDCGYEIYIDFETNRMVFEFIPPIEKREIILSLDFENITSAKYDSSLSQSKNVAYAGGDGEAENRTFISVFENDIPSKGLYRRETFIDCGSLKMVDEYALTLETEAKHRLEEFKATETIETEIPDNLEEEIELGYFVMGVIKIMNLAQQKQVTEITEVYEPSRIARYATLGDGADDTQKTIKKLTNQEVR